MNNTSNTTKKESITLQSNKPEPYKLLLGTIYVIVTYIIATLIVDRLPESIRPKTSIVRAGYKMILFVVPVTFVIYLIYRTVKKRKTPIIQGQQPSSVRQDLKGTLGKSRNQMLVISSFGWGIGFPCILILLSMVSITTVALVGQELKPYYDVWSVANGVIPYLVIFSIVAVNIITSAIIIKKVLRYFASNF